MHASPLGAPTGFASCVPRRCSARCTGRVGVSRVGRTSIAAVGDPGPVQNEAPVVIYEDATMLAVDKPHRLSFHSDDLERVEAGLATPGISVVRQGVMRRWWVDRGVTTAKTKGFGG